MDLDFLMSANIRQPLMALALLVLVVVSIPVSGGPSGLASFTRTCLRVLHPALPLGVAAGAVRGVVYFGSHGTAGPLQRSQRGLRPVDSDDDPQVRGWLFLVVNAHGAHDGLLRF